MLIRGKISEEVKVIVETLAARRDKTNDGSWHQGIVEPQFFQIANFFVDLWEQSSQGTVDGAMESYSCTFGDIKSILDCLSSLIK